jgi:hypothetical protein
MPQLHQRFMRNGTFSETLQIEKLRKLEDEIYFDIGTNVCDSFSKRTD